MILCVKPLSQKEVGTKASTSYMFSIFFFIFASFLKLISKSQMTMDKHRHKIFATFFAFHDHISSKEKKIQTLSIIHKQTRKLNKKREMK
jgi:hypothetical protein